MDTGVGSIAVLCVCICVHIYIYIYDFVAFMAMVSRQKKECTIYLKLQE